MVVQQFLNQINQFIINPIVVLLFVLAFAVFVWGIFQFILSQTSDENRAEGKRKIFWGLFGLFVMFSVYGLIRLILNTFGISSGYLFS